MAVMDLAAFQTLIDRRYREIVEFEYATQVDQIPSYYSMATSDSHEERRGSVGEMPTWDVFDGQIPYHRIFEQYNSIATHIEFAQGMIWQRRLVDDDLTGIMRGDRFRPMVRSGLFTRQEDAARLFNFAASNDVKFYVRSEGVPLASNSHTTRTDGVSTATGFDNLTTAPLSRTAYRAARIQMRRFANDRGQIMNVIGDGLVVPIDLEPLAREIMESTQHPDDANNAKNVEAGTAEVMVCIHMSDTNDWALVNKMMMKENCYWFDRVQPEFQSMVDFETKQLKASGYGRWSTLVLDWRWLLFGSVS